MAIVGAQKAADEGTKELRCAGAERKKQQGSCPVSIRTSQRSMSREKTFAWELLTSSRDSVQRPHSV